MPEPDDGFGLRDETRPYLLYVTNQQPHTNIIFHHIYIYMGTEKKRQTTFRSSTDEIFETVTWNNKTR